MRGKAVMRYALACGVLLLTACTRSALGQTKKPKKPKGVKGGNLLSVTPFRNMSLPHYAHHTPANPKDPHEGFRAEGKGLMFRSIDEGHILPKLGNAHGMDGGTPGDFSLYVFAMSWEAEWCLHSHHAGCLEPRDYWKQNLTIHGLWPDYGDSSYPTSCTDETFNHETVVGKMGLDTLKDVWPNVEVRVGARETPYSSFWEHEWVKHGSCTGLSQATQPGKWSQELLDSLSKLPMDYFKTSVKIATERFPTPDVLVAQVGRTVTRRQLDEAYGGKGKAVLQCRMHHGLHYLSQIMICFDKDGENGGPGTQIVCPIPVLLHDGSCERSEIHIAAFQASTGERDAVTEEFSE